ncbi:MAG: UPF0175 family protein [Thermoflexales bacterium]|nr:UPF0175 family protein [Thermoflexales bacterium]
MSMLTVSLEWPRDLLGALDVPEARLQARLWELIAIGLFREGHVSSGKCAELLGISKVEFVRLLDRHGVCYFTESAEELVSEVTRAEQLVKGDS